MVNPREIWLYALILGRVSMWTCEALQGTCWLVDACTVVRLQPLRSVERRSTCLAVQDLHGARHPAGREIIIFSNIL